MNPNELASKNVLINISKKEKFFFLFTFRLVDVSIFASFYFSFLFSTSDISILFIYARIEMDFVGSLYYTFFFC